MKTVISLFAAICLASAAVAGDSEKAPLMVRVRVVDRSEPRKEKDAGIEPWIGEALVKAGHASVVPKSKWITLSAEEKKLESGNGHYIDGKVTQEKGEFKVEIEGCAGIRLHAAAKLKMQPGERTVLNLKASETKTGTFIAVEVIQP
jgi:hypothetical protein